MTTIESPSHEEKLTTDTNENPLKRFWCRMLDSNGSYWLIGIVILIFIVLTSVGLAKIVNQADTSGHVYKAIGFGMIMIWICIFICYFIWAVYFYNFKYGYSRKVWKKIEEAKANRSKGNFYRQEDIDQEPQNNPYKDETFGLPRGTVRGMIAFTLLFGSIAMLIVSFGMKNEIHANGFFIDQFDFFKKAFLMMIAFYFGTHSLKYLKPSEPTRLGGNNVAPPTPQKPDAETESQKVVIVTPENDSSQTQNQEMPPIVAIDPMAPKPKK